MARTWAAIALTALLAGCGDDPPPPEPSGALAPLEATTRVMIDRPLSAEIGRSHFGFVLSASGEAVGVGWRTPRLRPVTGVAGPDGFIEFEFIATPPAASTNPGPQRLRADTQLAPEQIAFAVGARVLGREAAVEALFPRSEQAEETR